ncbi:MAG: M42 family metallopeptidase [Ruminococcaceae bacterium]|nr:M42 family metallopeptidase [Oscillospiraceae bacterium]
MIELLKQLCMLDGTSGDEGTVRQFVISQIKDYCEYRVDNLGNIIAFKKGKNTPQKKVLIDAHLDEVGLIITHIEDNGFLRFSTVGGIDTAALMFRKVLINGNTLGVIGGKPVHLCDGDERKKLPSADSLYIDLGVSSKEEAEKLLSVGDCAVMCSDFTVIGDKILSKALDDRVGCAVLINLLKQDSEFDFYASFSTQEEVGLRGAKVAAFTAKPDAAIVIDGTTAADVAGVAVAKQVCRQGEGAVVSFMDGATSYDREYYNAALNSGIKAQSKCAVAGGNNAGAIHLSRGGVRTVALSVPCRYIHTAGSTCNMSDVVAVRDLTKYMINKIAGGEL